MAEAFLPESLLEKLFLPAGQPPGQLLVAFSGGLDSSVLLHALVRLRAAGRLEGHRLEAFHVNHGLHGDAGAWEQWCRERTAALDVPLAVRRVRVAAARGDSEEALARRARYEALLAVLEPGGRLLTAHHADDQLETVLLALCRGAGTAGLAGMPAVMARGRGWHLRPLLDVPRARLREYAATQGFDWLEDPANRELRFTRAWLRETLVPVLRRRWPGIEGSVARSARLCAAGEQLARELAALDLGLAAPAEGGAGEPVAGPGGVEGGAGTFALPGAVAATLAVGRLAGLAEHRQANALRHWIRLAGHPLPPERRLRGALPDLLGEKSAGATCVRWERTELRRYRDRLYLMAPLATAGGAGRPLSPSWTGVLPRGLGRVKLAAAGADVPAHRRLCAAALRGAVLTIGFRRGGERVRLPGRAGSRRLKHLLQEWGVVPWMRGRVPLLEVNGEIAAIADLTVTAPFAARAGEPAVVLVWLEHPPIH